MEMEEDKERQIGKKLKIRGGGGREGQRWRRDGIKSKSAERTLVMLGLLFLVEVVWTL